MADISPTVTSLSPTNAIDGLLTITGSNFDSSPNETFIFIGDTECSIQTISSTQIECTLGQSEAGTFRVLVQITSIGYSNTNVNFTYNLQVDSLSSTQGSTFGGLNLIISGSGFSTSTNVSICGKACPLLQSNYSSITCIVSINNYFNSCL